MGNFAALVGCPSKDAAQTKNHWSRYWDEDLFEKTGWGPVWLSKYCIGGFWLGCFSPEDEILIDRDDGEYALPAFVGYFTSVEKAIERLTTRKIAILSLIPQGLRASYSDLYDIWVQALSAQFKEGVFLDCDDIFGMIGHEEGSDALREQVALMASLKPDSDDVDVIDFGLTGLVGVGEVSASGAESTSVERLAKDWQYSVTADPAIESETWPPAPAPEELAFASQVISDTRRAEAQKSYEAQLARKPWWKFW
jgi:hypothetical protein